MMRLQEIIKNEKPHGLYGRVLYRLASYTVYILEKENIKVTPNQVTLLSLLSILLFSLCILFNNITLAVFLFLLYSVSDCVDGVLARYKKLSSDFGAIWDPLVDRYNSIIIYYVLGIYAFVYFNNYYFLIIAGIIFTLSHIPHEFKYYFEKYNVNNISIRERKSLLSRILFELFSYDKYLLLLPLILLFCNNEIGLYIFFGYSLLMRIVWVLKFNVSFLLLYLRR